MERILTMEAREHLTEAMLWAAGLAVRLRRLEADPAGPSALTWRQATIEEFQEAFRHVALEARPARLQALSREFPSVDLSRIPLPAVEGEAPGEGPARLFSLAQAMPSAKRKEFLHGLAHCRLSTGDPDASRATLTIPEEMRAQFNLPPTLTAERASWLLFFLAEQVFELEKTLRSVWDQVSAGSTVKLRLPREVRPLVEGFLKGEPSLAGIQETLEATIRLLNALFLALGTGTHSYAVSHWQRFSPVEVANSAEIEKRANPLKFWKWLQTQSSASWKKYDELCKNVSNKSIEKEIIGTIVTHAVELISQPNHRPSAPAGEGRATPVVPR